MTATGDETPPRRLCDVEGCDTVHYARGWCFKHYRRVRATGDPGPAGEYIRAPGQVRPDRWAARSC